MEMQFKNEIKKLADIVVWADNLITSAGFNEEKYKNDALSAYCHVKAHELWKIKTVVLESIDRHTVYTNALNADIVAKDAKIDLLEKELEGRKEGYVALKKRMDTDYISIDEHNDICKAYEDKIAKLEKESKKWQDLAKMNRDTIVNQYEVCEEFKKKIAELEKELSDCKVKIRHQKENLDGINKTLEIRTKENERLIAVKKNQDKEIEAHESENARLTERIKSLRTELANERNAHTLTRDREEAYKQKILEKNDTINKLREEQKTLVDICDKYKKENGDYAVRVNNLKKELEEYEDLKTNNAKRRTEIIELRDKIQELEKQNEYLTKELNQTCTCKELDLKGHQSRETALVNALADKNDEIKDLKGTIEYYKDQERIRTNQLRATESKVEELWGLVNELKKEKKEVDDYAKSGFKLYVKNTLTEAEGDKNEANEIITEAIRSAYTEWNKTQIYKKKRRNQEGTKKELNEAFGVPCGEDSIE